jgi:hypothetical protein
MADRSNPRAYRRAVQRRHFARAPGERGSPRGSTRPQSYETIRGTRHLLERLAGRAQVLLQHSRADNPGSGGPQQLRPRQDRLTGSRSRLLRLARSFRRVTSCRSEHGSPALTGGMASSFDSGSPRTSARRRSSPRSVRRDARAWQPTWMLSTPPATDAGLADGVRPRSETRHPRLYGLEPTRTTGARAELETGRTMTTTCTRAASCCAAARRSRSWARALWARASVAGWRPPRDLQHRGPLRKHRHLHEENRSFDQYYGYARRCRRAGSAAARITRSPVDGSGPRAVRAPVPGFRRPTRHRWDPTHRQWNGARWTDSSAPPRAQNGDATSDPYYTATQLPLLPQACSATTGLCGPNYFCSVARSDASRTATT